MANPDGWAPDACTLPTSDRPLRLDVVLRPIIEAAARDLAGRERVHNVRI